MTSNLSSNVALADFYENGVENLSFDFFKACSALGLDKELRLFACRCVRDTLLPDGRKVWDYLLFDERSHKAVEVAERYANGEATEHELNLANTRPSGFGSWAAAFTTAKSAADAAEWAADWATYWAASTAPPRGFLREILPLDTFLAAAQAKGITEPKQLFPIA